MKVRCASCGEHEDRDVGNYSEYGARHLRVCPARDDLLYVPWWTKWFPDTLEVGWHPLNVNDPIITSVGYLENPPSTYQLSAPRVSLPVQRHRFTEYAEREIICVRTAA